MIGTGLAGFVAGRLPEGKGVLISQGVAQLPNTVAWACWRALAPLPGARRMDVSIYFTGELQLALRLARHVGFDDTSFY
jgi:hypothetical protein